MSITLFASCSVSEFLMRIAKPLLLITTPIGMIGGVHEAFRLAGGLAFLMIAMMLMIGAAFAMVVMTIRKERRAEAAGKHSPDTLEEITSCNS
jgi:hypothetical protein